MPAALQLILASSSPRRSDLLRQIGMRFAAVPADIDEARLDGEPVDEHVVRLAREKAQAVAAVLEELGFDPHLPVLGADTVVVLEGELIGKPRDELDARATLRRLSGRVHEVLTAIAIVRRVPNAEVRVALSRSVVEFRPLEEREVVAYAATREPHDKAGAYGVQGVGSIFVARIEGSYSGVMGLPLVETEALLSAFGVDTWQYRGD